MNCKEEVTEHWVEDEAECGLWRVLGEGWSDHLPGPWRALGLLSLLMSNEKTWVNGLSLGVTLIAPGTYNSIGGVYSIVRNQTLTQLAERHWIVS